MGTIRTYIYRLKVCRVAIITTSEIYSAASI